MISRGDSLFEARDYFNSILIIYSFVHKALDYALLMPSRVQWQKRQWYELNYVFLAKLGFLIYILMLTSCFQVRFQRTSYPNLETELSLLSLCHAPRKLLSDSENFSQIGIKSVNSYSRCNIANIQSPLAFSLKKKLRESEICMREMPNNLN